MGGGVPYSKLRSSEDQLVSGFVRVELFDVNHRVRSKEVMVVRFGVLGMDTVTFSISTFLTFLFRCIRRIQGLRMISSLSFSAIALLDYIIDR